MPAVISLRIASPSLYQKPSNMAINRAKSALLRSLSNAKSVPAQTAAEKPSAPVPITTDIPVEDNHSPAEEKGQEEKRGDVQAVIVYLAKTSVCWEHSKGKTGAKYHVTESCALATGGLADQFPIYAVW